MKAFNGVKKIGAYDLVVMDELREKYPEKFVASGQMDYKWFEKDIRPHNFVYVRQDVNSLAFTLKSEKTKGCEVVTIIEAAKMLLEDQYKQDVTKEHSLVLSKLNDVIEYLK